MLNEHITTFNQCYQLDNDLGHSDELFFFFIYVRSMLISSDVTTQGQLYLTE